MYWLPHAINALALAALLVTRGSDTITALVVQCVFAVLLLLLLLPEGKVDPVTIKVYSLLLNLFGIIPVAFFDLKTAISLLASFWLPTVVYFRWLMFTPSASEILPGKLFLGNIKSASEEFVKKIGITHIIEVHDKFKNHTKIQDIEYLSFDFDDRSFVDISAELDQSTVFITQSTANDGVVLVHCSAGVSRSASLVIGYLMASQKLDFPTAFQYVRARRSVVDPNCGFVACLRAYQRKLGI